MKKSLVLLFAFLVSMFGFSTQINAAEVQTCVITTSGTAQAELTPDIISFDVEVLSTSKDSMAKAVSENKQACAKVYEYLKKTLDKASNDTVSTSSYSATPVYRYNNNKKVLDYYQVRTVIKVKTKNVENAGQIIDGVVANGATSVNNISYDISNYDAESNKLLALASQKAKEQAESIVKSIGNQLAGIKNIECSSSLSSRNQIMPLIAQNAKCVVSFGDAAADSISVPTKLEPGTMNLYAKVVITFYIK